MPQGVEHVKQRLPYDAQAPHCAKPLMPQGVEHKKYAAEVRARVEGASAKPLMPQGVEHSRIHPHAAGQFVVPNL